MHGRWTWWNTVGVMAIAVSSHCPSVGWGVDVPLPAIDPSGRRIFLPPPSSTQLNLDKDRWLQRKVEKDKEWLRNLWPKPAYQNPPSIPHCGSPQADLPALPREEAPEIKTKSWLPHDKLLSKVLPPPGAWLEDANVQVAPLRTIARVGSEVILVGGVCTEPGILIRGEVVEWYLLPRSVGQFTDGGSQYFGPVHNLLFGRATYAEPEYVLSLGAPGPRLLTRGTKVESDDILLEPGQAWVSLFSNDPGTSYVVAYAPRMPECDAQRVQAIVHWVEGEWDFPPPATARAGTTHDLTTTVRKFQTGEPLGGWTVRYDVLSGPGIFENDDKTSTVVTNGDGLATVRIKSPPDQAGSTRVGITVTQPAQVGEQPLVVGRGETTVDWNAVNLDLKIEGPPTAYLDQEVNYTVTISNLGDAPSPPLTLIDDLPPELIWLGSDQPDVPGGQRHSWQIASIPPKDLRQVIIRARTNRVGRFQHCVSLLNVEGGPRQSCISTLVDAPPLEVQVTGETAVDRGERTTFHVEVTNRGNVELSDLRLRAEFTPGLQHFDPELNGPAPQSEGGVLERPLGNLAPGQSQSADITFTTLDAGSQCVRVVASTAQAEGTSQACVQVDAPAAAPDVALRIESANGTTDALRIGEGRVYNIIVQNIGNTALHELQIDIEADGALEISQATPGFAPTSVGIVFRESVLEAGQTITKQVEVRAESARATSCLQATLLNREGLDKQDRVCPPIANPGDWGNSPNGPSAPPRTEPPGPSTPPATGGAPSNSDVGAGSNSLSLVVRTDRNTARVGVPANLFVRLVSQSTYEIQDVEVRIYLDPGLDFDSAVTSLDYQPSADGRTITFEGILSIRPGDEIPLQIRVVPRTAGNLSATVEIQGAQFQTLRQTQVFSSNP